MGFVDCVVSVLVAGVMVLGASSTGCDDVGVSFRESAILKIVLALLTIGFI